MACKISGTSPSIVIEAMGRKGISNHERKALRAWAFSQQPQPRQKAIIAWFEAEFGRKLSQSTVSESLDDRFRHLDALPASASGTSISDTAYRSRAAAWPLLESILYEWQQGIQVRGGLVSGDILAEKAREIWRQIPAYQGQAIPEFSSGWVSKFKQRYRIAEVTQHGEQSSVPTQTAAEMVDVQNICIRYPDSDIFNMDETGLYWRWAISRGLATASMPGVKKDKARVSIMLCCNATGTERVAPWVIGKSKQPRALRGVNILAIGCVWGASKKGWVNTSIMAEWLAAFYSYIGLRKVVLLMDNYLAHLSGLQQSPPPSNIAIQLLPKNSTSMYQPLDQGIIQNFKTYYRRQWLAFTVKHYNLGLDPFKFMTILYTLHWIAESWLLDIKDTTILHCYIKSTCIPKRWLDPSSGLDREEPIESLYQAAAQAGQIQDPMAIENFLNPVDEDLEEEEEDTSLQDIVVAQLGLVQGLEEEEEVLPPPAPSVAEALQAVQVLLCYQEYQETAKYEDISYMKRLERSLKAQSIRSMRQSTISEWLQVRQD